MQSKYSPRFKAELCLKFLECYEVHTLFPCPESAFDVDHVFRVEVNHSEYPLTVFRGDSFRECLEDAMLATGFDKNG